MVRWLCRGLLLCGLMFFAYGALAEPAVNTNGTDFALGGVDVVAYFSDGRPLHGTREHRSGFAGATWLFASAQHKALFDRTPQKYLPAYKGYCAYGVSRNNLVKIDPEAFTIRGGKLYLNYSLDVRAVWLKDPETYIAKANANWPRL